MPTGPANRLLPALRRAVLGREAADRSAFLVLARRAAAVRPRETVGNWRYGVAYRTALKARGSWPAAGPARSRSKPCPSPR